MRLLDRVREAMRMRHYSLGTETVYISWIRRFILFQDKRHPSEMGKHEVEAYLSYLAARRGVSPATQEQALQALLFLYRRVLEIELPWLDDVIRAKPKRRLPVVLNRDEVRAMLEFVAPASGPPQQPDVRLRPSRYGVPAATRGRSGFSPADDPRARWEGGKDRMTVLPDHLGERLHAQVDSVSMLHQQDLAAGLGGRQAAGAASGSA